MSFFFLEIHDVRMHLEVRLKKRMIICKKSTHKRQKFSKISLISAMTVLSDILCKSSHGKLTNNGRHPTIVPVGLTRDLS